MGGLFSKPSVPQIPKEATDAQDDAAEQAEADRKRKSKQLAAQKNASVYGGKRQLLYSDREDPQLGIPSGSGASSLGSSTV